MPISRSPKKKLKSATATGKKKAVAPAKKKSAVKGKKVAAPAKKKSGAAAKKPRVAAKKKSAAPGRNKSVAPSKGQTGVTLDPVAAQGSQAAFQRYLTEARALTADEVTPLRFAPELAYYNLRIGVAAIEPYHDRLKIELSHLDLVRVFDLPELGQAVLFAASQAATHSGVKASSAPPLKGQLSEGNQLRGKLLKAADTLAAFGHVPASVVTKIRKGKGGMDTARDLGDLAALYSQYGAAFRDNTPVTAEQAKRAAELGSILLARLSPKSGRKVAAVPSEADTDRDRLATLLVRGHRDLRRAGYWIWADDCDEHVPSLFARVKARKKVVAPTAQLSPVA